MSVLTLVRHGQASYLADDYDRLSPLGEVQARKLGEYWLRHNVGFDVAIHGPRERHVRTGAIIAGQFREAGRAWPEPAILEEFDEYPAMEVMKAFLPVLAARHEQMRLAAEAFQRADGGPERIHMADRLLQEVTLRWVNGEIGSPEIESWEAFCERVRRGVGKVRALAPKSSRVVVFTSGGPMAASTRMALELSYRATLELTWSPRNGSYAEFLFSGERFSLSSFNCHPHLDEPSLLTYR